MPREEPLNVCYCRTHSRMRNKDSRHALRSARQNLLETRALSERKWLSTGKGRISYQSYFQ